METTYDPTSNIITVTGGTEVAPYTFSDVYDADKAGTLQLLAPVAGGLDLSLDRQVRLADDKALNFQQRRCSSFNMEHYRGSNASDCHE